MPRRMAAKLLEPIHPAEILFEEFMKPMAVSINALSREIAVPPNRVSDIVNGKRGITADAALRLAKRTTWLKAEPRVRAHSA